MRRRIKFLLFLGVLVLIIIASVVYIPNYFGSVLYPLDYKKEIKQSAAEFNVNPNFVAAVIYTESHFNPRSTSGVGARGLMQIMPPTGAGIAKALGDKDYTADKLYEPTRNIRYGTYYLHTLLKSYKQNESLVLMHYNGGGGAVRSYQKGNGLPYETQGFVRKVTSTKSMYDQIYGDWWNRAEFNKPQTKSATTSVINIRDFWRVLLSGGSKE